VDDRTQLPSGGLLRRLAALLIRSADSRYILNDLDEIMEKEMAAGLPRWRARARYLVNAFASALSVRGSGSRGSGSGGFSWLDVKLGFRMLVKYPGLTIVGGLAIAFSIWCGASFFEFVTQVVRPSLGFEQGDRMVGIQVWNARSSWWDSQLLFDYASWRDEVQSIEDLGAIRTVERNLGVTEGRAEPALVAELTASAFQLPRVSPIMGRGLAPSDEAPNAAPVIVLGHEVWQTRFQGAPDIVGRTVRIGSELATVIGVMPAGFTYPMAHHVWTPLSADVVAYEPYQGPDINVVGRLAPGVSLREAQAELTNLGARAAAAYPDTHATMRPQVRRFAAAMMGMPSLYSLGLASSNVFVLMLLVLVCGNVALLMFARAATRESELVVRNALGASRRRIVLQLFTEALVLGGLGAVIGLAGAGYGLRLVFAVVEAEVIDSGMQLPFWFHDSLSPITIFYAAVLTVLVAVVSGVVPALKVTGRGVETRLRQSAVGGQHVRFGGIWSAVIVTQVAVTVAFPSTAFYLRRDLVSLRAYDFGFPAEQYFSAHLQMDRIVGPDGREETPEETRARFQTSAVELERRLASEPGVTGTTFTSMLPGMYHEWNQVELDQGAVAPPDERGHRVGSAVVEPGYFDALGAPVLAGRGFHSGDLEPGQRVAIVNESFVQRVLGGGNAIGLRLRYVDFDDNREAEPEWHEIVGVVPNLGVQNGYGTKGIYHPARVGDVYPVFVAVHVTGDPQAFGPRLRALAGAVDPTLRLGALAPVSDARANDLVFYTFWYRLAVFVSWVALFLALAGIYAVMAFTVSRRTREIGIRVALGSDPRRVALAIFRRPLIQVGLGVALGMAWTAFMAYGVAGGSFEAGRIGEAISVRGVALVGAYALIMMGLCMLACVVPTRRALAVEPTEALRADI
jgi:putative ABC transport system permease protein